MVNHGPPNSAPKLAIVEAGNIRGLGSVAVCIRLLPAIVEQLLKAKYRIKVHISNELLSAVDLASDKSGLLTIIKEKNDFFCRLQRLSRYFIGIAVRHCDLMVILGDLPMRSRARQTLFLQQYNIVSPEVDPSVGQSLKFQMMRFIFKRNIRFASKIIVQTEALRRGLILSYGIASEGVSVVRHMAPRMVNEFEIKPQKKIDSNGLVFFYPASLYDYKNHEIIWAIVPLLEKIGLHVQFDLTLSAEQVPVDIRNSSYIRCLGVLSPTDCLNHYLEVDALIFPSRLESYGLPLIEASRIAKIPVFAADRPYAREVCGDLAVYFDPEKPEDLLEKLKRAVSVGLNPIKAEDIEKLPLLVSWDEMARQLLL
jgi:glycosyltransferase involved in cell wall biosynthesis